MKIIRPIESGRPLHLCKECGGLVAFLAAELVEEEGRPTVVAHGECPQGHPAVLERGLGGRDAARSTPERGTAATEAP